MTDDTDDEAWQPDEVLEVELTDVLDLHTFAPRQVKDLVMDYLEACWAQGFAQVRIIHGKGRGTLRRTVHAVCDRHPAVREYQLAGVQAGGWGATLVRLHEPKERA